VGDVGTGPNSRTEQNRAVNKSHDEIREVAPVTRHDNLFAFFIGARRHARARDDRADAALPLPR
jgi:hypothetical protein